MKVSWDGIRCLSWPFVIGFVLVTNIPIIIIRTLNQSWLMPVQDPLDFIVTGGLMVFTSLLAFGIVYSPRLRGLVTAEERIDRYDPQPFRFIGGLTAVLGVVAIVLVVAMILSQGS